MAESKDNQLAPVSGKHAESGPAPPSLFSDGEAPPLPTAANAEAKPKVLTRWLLPGALFVIGIALIAWIAQYLPGRGRRPPAQAEDVKVDPLRFEGGIGPRGEIRPIFFPDDDNEQHYIPEYELGASGRYDFAFVNTTNSEVELGVFEASCACSAVQVCVFQSTQQHEEYRQAKDLPAANWVTVEKDKTMRKAVTLPAQARAILRVSWRGNATEPEQLRMKTTVWSRAGSAQERTVKHLEILVNYVYPVLFEREKIDLGSLNPKDSATASFVCWSPTRDIIVKPVGTDKRIKVEAQLLPTAEREALHKKLREQWVRAMSQKLEGVRPDQDVAVHHLSAPVNTRLRCAYRVTVTLIEEIDGAQLDMGLFLKSVPIAITSDGQPIQVPLPTLRANVRGDVTLVSQEEGGGINLKIFSAKLGTSKKVTLSAPKGANLSFVGCDPVLLDLEVDLKALQTEGDKTLWEMEVVAKPNYDGGILPEDGVLVLSCQHMPPGAAAQ